MLMNLERNKLLILQVLLVLVLLVLVNGKKKKIHPSRYGKERQYNEKNTKKSKTQKICVRTDETIKARHKSCLLRPDTGPCRADLVAWYYDAKQHKCFRFFWGGCQGNGNKFFSLEDCMNSCYINTTMAIAEVPNYCSLAFDYGTCYGQYNRWAWDTLYKGCRRRLYSGCGGNQNNFETYEECMANCLLRPNNTLFARKEYTTCVPFTLSDNL